MQTNTPTTWSDSTISSKQIESFLEATSANAYWKDREGRYLGCNSLMLSFNNIKSDQCLIGKTDQDLWWRDQAPSMMKNDREVALRDKANTFIEVTQAESPIVPALRFLSYKTPLRTQTGKIIGIFGASFLMKGEETLFTALNELSTFINPVVIEKIAQSDHLTTSKTTSLTPRQLDCLYYLVKGMTHKQIATTLNLSPKTIEHYLDAIKIKLDCTDRAELTTKALQMPEIINQL